MNFTIKIKPLLFSIVCLFINFAFCNEEHCKVNNGEDSNSCEKLTEKVIRDGVTIYPSLTGLKQDDPILIEAIKNVVIIHPDKKPLNLTYSASMKHLNGQFSQPKTVEDILKSRLSKKKWKKKVGNGFFVEAGASEGEHISNTLYFELNHKWTGLLVEPNPDFIAKLVLKHRNAWVLPHCLSTKPQVEIVTFDAYHYNGGIIAEGKTFPGDIGRKEPLKEPPPNRRTIQVQCFPLYSVLMAIGNPAVDYMSLDIEGAELPVLKTVPWDKVSFELIGIEMVHVGQVFDGSRDDLVTFMEQNGYKFQAKAGHDEFYAKDVQK